MAKVDKYPLLINSVNVNSFPMDFGKIINSNPHVRNRIKGIRICLRRDLSTIKEKDQLEVKLFKLIPLTYFGTRKNKKLFFKIVHRIIYHRRLEFIFINMLYENFDNCFEWSCKLNRNESFQDVLLATNIFLLEKCIKPFIRKHFFYVALGRLYMNMVELFPRSKWQKFKNAILQLMLRKQHIELHSEYENCIPRGALCIIPKNSCNDLCYRPIISYYRNNETKEELKKIKNIKSKLKAYIRKQKLYQSSIYMSWTHFISKLNVETIYGIKADIKDSFGNIDINKLIWLIEKLPKEYCINSEKVFLTKRVKEQYVSIGCRKSRIVARWSHGLLQGDRLSSVLCDLYYSCIVDKCLNDCMKEKFFFHRIVDDYIFCSTDQKCVERFAVKLSGVVKLNENKLVTNLEDKNQMEITYCGYILNLHTKEVTPAYNVNIKDKMSRLKFKLCYDSLSLDIQKYFEDVMNFSCVSFYFNKCVFNTHYNSEESILKVYFQNMLFLAFKFDCAVMQLKYYRKLNDISSECITRYIIKTIVRYAKITLNITNKNKGKFFADELSSNTLESVGARAFILILHRRSVVYKDIVLLLKKMVYMKFKLFGSLEIKYFKELPRTFLTIS